MGERTNGDLVFAACRVFTPLLSDHAPEPIRPYFTAGFHGTELAWKVQIYQWQETRSEDCKIVNGEHNCTVRRTYERQWVDDAIPSTHFTNELVCDHKPCVNTGNLPSNLVSGSFIAPEYTVTLLDSRGKKGF